jgi:hypothetical protein
VLGHHRQDAPLRLRQARLVNVGLCQLSPQSLPQSDDFRG